MTSRSVFCRLVSDRNRRYVSLISTSKLPLCPRLDASATEAANASGAIYAAAAVESSIFKKSLRFILNPPTGRYGSSAKVNYLYYNATVQDSATRNPSNQRFPQGTSFASQRGGRYQLTACYLCSRPLPTEVEASLFRVITQSANFP